MRSRHPDGPWNPGRPLEVAWKEYERQVLRWLRESEGEPTDLEVNHLEKVAGSAGEYEIDVVVRFRRFGGAEFTVLVECKRYSSAVKRKEVTALHATLAEVGAHKAMMFSTGGFQKGAVEYASKHGIALIVFRDGRASYETRWQDPAVEPPSWAELPRFVGHSLSITEPGRVNVRLVDDGHLDAVREFLTDA